MAPEGITAGKSLHLPVNSFAILPITFVMTIDTFAAYESEVRTYCRSFPAVFATARDSEVFDEHGQRWIDFFAGAGALNYGHNPQFIKQKLLRYIESDGITHALDFHTSAKRCFIEDFVDTVLTPRGLDYKLQFCGPTGANAVEAALKLARKATGRTQIASFSGGWHGMTSGCLSVTSRLSHRRTAGAPLANVTMFRFPVGPQPFPEALDYIEYALTDSHSGVERPAAFILEGVQAEGGVYPAPVSFLRGLRELCDRFGILLILDEIQTGCGRTGRFFSFEHAGITPDIVCLSKSIGGYGLPMSLLLMRPSLDVWSPGEHTGTFRGHQLAFVAARAALDFWRDRRFAESITEKGEFAMATLAAGLHGTGAQVRGLGMIGGVDLAGCGGGERAKEASRLCFERGLIVETCGRDGAVLKLLPPLTIPVGLLGEGVQILLEAVRAA